VTNQDGRYLISDVSTGQVEIRVITLGYGQQTQTVTVTANGTVTADFRLDISAIGEDVRFDAGAGVCTATKDAIAASQGWAETVPEIADLRIAPGGDIWVLRGAARGEAPGVEVFAADGRFLGALPEGTPFPGAFTGPDTFVTRDETGLAKYRVVR
jgi:hypothetical protein